MLIYNFQKEFLGIDKKDLNTLGFADLASLKAEVSDFADLFVKTPGYIHNFQHVHWIDFITCAESNEKPKAIVNVNSKSFKCTIDIKTAFLTDNPAAEAYLVYLSNLHPLSEEESKLISADLSNKTLQKAQTVSQHEIQEQVPKATQSTLLEDELDTFNTSPIIEDLAMQPSPSIETQPLLDDDFKLDVTFDDTESFVEQKPQPQVQEIAEEKQPVYTPPPIVNTPEPIEEEEEEEDDYVFDPNVASTELGLPLDLIEEFIQDFIIQAKEFKEDLYNSLENGDLDNVKILSHKLKGVAANLRIENAFEVLSTINTSSDTVVIKKNIHKFYKIIAKLAGEEIEKKVTPPKAVQEKIPEPQEQEEKLSEEKLSIDLDIPEPTEEKITIDLDALSEEEEPQKEEMPLELSLQDEDEKLDINLEVQEEKVEETTPEKVNQEEVEEEEEFELSIKEENHSKDEPLELQLDIPEEIQIEEPQLVDEIEEKAIITYSKKTIANEIGIDLNSFNELLHEYQEESHNIFANMQTALENGDTAIYNTELAKFKSMTENMRIKDFNEILENLSTTHNKDEVAQDIKTINNILIQILNQGD